MRVDELEIDWSEADRARLALLDPPADCCTDRASPAAVAAPVRAAHGNLPEQHEAPDFNEAGAGCGDSSSAGRQCRTLR